MKMKRYQYVLFLLLVGLGATGMKAQEAKYPPLSEYMMARDAEIALAKSAAPQAISDRATIRVLTTSGYQTAHEGDNGFLCTVMRGFTVAPTFAPAQMRPRTEVSFAYMWSADQVLGPAGHWHPHLMVYLPYYENSMLGNNEVAGMLPFVSDDAGTPFAVGIIAMDDKMAIKARP